MKKWMEKHIGVSWKTTLAGYFLAAFVAVQPLLTETIDWNSKHEVMRYVFRLVAALAIAVFGKYSADSAQVKEVHTEVKEVQEQANVNTALIDQHLIVKKAPVKRAPVKKKK